MVIISVLTRLEPIIRKLGKRFDYYTFTPVTSSAVFVLIAVQIVDSWCNNYKLSFKLSFLQISN